MLQDHIKVFPAVHVVIVRGFLLFGMILQIIKKEFVNKPIHYWHVVGYQKGDLCQFLYTAYKKNLLKQI